MSDYPNASNPDPSVYDETGVDAFVFEDDNMFAEDDFDDPCEKISYRILEASWEDFHLGNFIIIPLGQILD